MFGEPLHERALKRAVGLMELSRGGTLLVLGSSLMVSPVNRLPALAKKFRMNFLIVNLEPTDFDDDAHQVYRLGITEVLEETERLLKARNL